MAAVQYEHPPKTTTMIALRQGTSMCRDNRTYLSSAVQRTSACGRDEPAVAEGQLCTGTTGGGRQSGLGSRFPARWYRLDPELSTSFASKAALPRSPLGGPKCALGEDACQFLPVFAAPPACSRSKQATGRSISLCRALHVTQTRHQRASQRCTRRLLADSICRVLPKEVWASTSATGVQRSSGLFRQSACHSRGQ